MKRLILVALLLSIGTGSFAQLNLNKLKAKLTGGNLSANEVGEGLKEALTNGVSKGSDLVSQVDGYYKNPAIKIPFPPEIKHVEDRLREIGLGAQVDKFVLSLNRAAEDAAKGAKTIFVDAVKQMTIDDAFSILKGSQDAATQYLIKTTSVPLKAQFKPVIQNSLNKVDATKYYHDLITEYNKLPLVKKENPDLDTYATDKAADGIFLMIANEEKNIRSNPAARTSDLLKKVFSAQ